MLVKYIQSRILEEISTTMYKKARIMPSIILVLSQEANVCRCIGAL